MGRSHLKNLVLEVFQTPNMRVTKVSQVLCYRIFGEKDLDQGKSRMAHFKSQLLATQVRISRESQILQGFVRNCARVLLVEVHWFWRWFRGTPFKSPLQGGLNWGRGGDEGLKVEGGFTFARLQGGFKGASRGLQGFKGASRGLEGASP